MSEDFETVSRAHESQSYERLTWFPRRSPDAYDARVHRAPGSTRAQNEPVTAQNEPVTEECARTREICADHSPGCLQEVPLEMCASFGESKRSRPGRSAVFSASVPLPLVPRTVLSLLHSVVRLSLASNGLQRLQTNGCTTKPANSVHFDLARGLRSTRSRRSEALVASA
jgi:hypothetical protein